MKHAQQEIGLKDGSDDCEPHVITLYGCHPVHVIHLHDWVIAHNRLVCKAKTDHESQECD